MRLLSRRLWRAGARYAFPLAILLVLVSLPLLPARAGGLRVSPIIQALPADHNMAVYQVDNLREQPLTVQIRAWQWLGETGGRRLQPATDLVVVPPLVTLAPGQKQLVRVAWRGSVREQERDYRLHFQEIARRSTDPGLAVGTTVTLDLPLFLLAPDPRQQVEWRLIRDGDETRLSVHNAGNRYLRLPALSVSTGGAAPRGLGAGVHYILSGETREWPLPWRPAELGAGLTVHYQENGRTLSQRLANP